MSREGFHPASEYLGALIREARQRRAKQALDANLLEGLQGPAREMTVEDWDAIEREAGERIAREQTRA